MKRNRKAVSVGAGGVGCLISAFGAAAAPLAWAPRVSDSVHGGFEGQDRDLSVLLVGLPLIALGGALVPLLAWMLTTRWTGRPWAAALAASASLVLGIWGLLEYWTPQQSPGAAAT
ncbi:hypothetical protein [Streptomyces sp. NPDC048332]|uniref:hypothetical protein n=1 Tax=Streptomyces sp. NPDC048332 TaxID=3154619 RepID=UPI0034362758